MGLQSRRGSGDEEKNLHSCPESNPSLPAHNVVNTDCAMSSVVWVSELVSLIRLADGC
jgi:hypothetical protein